MKFYYYLRNKIIIFLTIILSPIFFIFAKRRGRDYGDRPRILVVPQLTRIGDLVCATPVFRAIKEKYPKSFLAVMVTGRVAPIIKNNPYIDEIIQYKTNDLLQVIKNIRGGFFNWSIALTPSPLISAVALLSLIPMRVKIIRATRPFGEYMTDWLNTETMLYRDHTYLPQRYLDLLKFIGIENVASKKDIFVSESGEKKADEFILKIKPQNSNPIIGISISAGNKIKEWGDDKFKELSKKITDKYGANIIIIGSKNDEPRIDNFLKDCPNDKFYKAVDFSLEELPSLIKRWDLYIGVDTGPIYIAEALSVPLIDIIGPVDPSEQPPCYISKCVCVLPPSNIKPTSFVFKRPGKNHERALEATSVGMVMEAVDKQLIK